MPREGRRIIGRFIINYAHCINGIKTKNHIAVMEAKADAHMLIRNSRSEESVKMELGVGFRLSSSGWSGALSSGVVALALEDMRWCLGF